jgi:NAD(P)-dependent dehydrogenase (short-subunit alcohol dehydrogenase family)
MNQSVLVTAGASGIGREIARAFAVQGAKVVVRDIDSKALETFAQEIPAITTVVCDVSSVTTLSTWWKLPSPS